MLYTYKQYSDTMFILLMKKRQYCLNGTKASRPKNLRPNQIGNSSSDFTGRLEKWRKSVVLAKGSDFLDALAGTQLAHQLNAPLLLTRYVELPESTEKEIKRLKAKKIVLLGSTGAILMPVEERIESNWDYRYCPIWRARPIRDSD